MTLCARAHLGIVDDPLVQPRALAALIPKSASQNCARQSVEELLNDKNVDKKDAKDVPLTLKARIDRYGASRSDEVENADRANNLRWIGNVGSHPGKVSIEGVFDAYEAFEVLLEDFCVGHNCSVWEIISAESVKKVIML